MKPKWHQKALGQNFLIDQKVSQKIVDTFLDQTRLLNIKYWIEIGPGKGALTHLLLKHLQKNETLTLIEKDREFSSFWKEQKNLSVQVIESDFLKLTPKDWLPKLAPVAVLSNLPYSASQNILSTLARYPNVIKTMVLMFQLEVAERIEASPGQKNTSSLSIWVQNKWNVSSIAKVSPDSFSPKPKVWSKVLQLTPKDKPMISETLLPEKEEAFQKLLQISFKHRRKMLRSALPKDSLYRKALTQSGINETKRSESLGWDEWQLFFRSFLNLGSSI